MSKETLTQKIKNFALIDIDVTKSIKANFLICWENFKRIAAGFDTFQKFVATINEDLNTDKISAEIRAKLLTNRVKLPINISLNINSEIDIKSTNNEFSFIVRRETPQTYKIQQSTEDKNRLKFDNLFIQCSQHSTGVVLYPVIQTFEDYIIITFSESIQKGFTIMFS